MPGAGIAEAQGGWIAFQDDDVWLPEKLEWQLRALDRFGSSCGACYTDARFINNPVEKGMVFERRKRPFA